MSVSRCVTIIGDSNVQRHMNHTNRRDRPLMLNSQVVQCGKLITFTAALKSIRAESNVCVLSCLTNFITSLPAQGSSSLSLVVEPVFESFLSKLGEACLARPDVSFLICPPMYRFSPIWYRDGLSEILRKFSEMMKCRPATAFMMPSFPSPSFDPDGVHLTPYSGLEFVLHMYDNLASVLDSAELDLESKSSMVSESSRLLEDRVMVLEQDHRRLNNKFEHKFAVDAELSDFQENIRCEPFFMIRGLPRLPKLAPKEWQTRAQSDVQGVLKIVMGREIPISYVMNSTGRGKDSITQYKVRLQNSAISKEIRDKFSTYFTGGVKNRPEGLSEISIRNCVTPATLARINILQLLGRRYQASNPGSYYHAVGFEPRPMLKLHPAKDASDQRVQTFNFIEAVEKLPTHFTQSEIDDLLKRISPKLYGSLKSLFIVLSDDMVKKPLSGPKLTKSIAQGGKGSTGSKGSKGSKGSGGSKGAASSASGGSGSTPSNGPSPSRSEGSHSESDASGTFKTPPARTSFKRGASGPATGSPASKK